MVSLSAYGVRAEGVWAESLECHGKSLQFG